MKVELRICKLLFYLKILFLVCFFCIYFVYEIKNKLYLKLNELLELLFEILLICGKMG